MKIISQEAYIEELKDANTSMQFDRSLEETVIEMIHQVREKGDQALKAYTKQFDGIDLDHFVVTEEEFQEAEQNVSERFIVALKTAKNNIERFHQEQRERSWFITAPKGVLLGQKVTPIDRVGIYVPGGKAAYPSTLLMNAIPAKLAGVPHIVLTTPPQSDGKVNPHVLVAARIAGIETIYKVGGAQAIAALAYGTETIQKVNKIVGPGNAYVASAKKIVFGDVDIDMIAGPSEICVVADETANVKYAAADLLSQAEHDEQAVAICITTSQNFAEKLQIEVERQTEISERKAIIKKSLKSNGRIVVAKGMEQALELVNEIAPEHLQLMVADPLAQLGNVRNAGAIFLGQYAPEALGDYVAGPNHTLPTSGTAVFSSPLGVYDFVKRSSVIQYTKDALDDVAQDIITLANAEGLSAHAEAIMKRKEDET